MSTSAASRTDAPARDRLGLIDCDIHPAMRSPAELDRWLPRRRQQHRREYGLRLRQPFTGTYPYPKSAPALARRDAWPPNGGPPGSDLDFMRQQHLDLHGIAYGMLQPLSVRGMDQRVSGFAEAISAAVNHWQHEEWTSREPRLKATIALPGEDAAAAVKKLERWAGHPDFVQISLVTRALEPLGRPRYWPIYEAAEHFDLPLGLHPLGTSGHCVTGGRLALVLLRGASGGGDLARRHDRELHLRGRGGAVPAAQDRRHRRRVGWVPSLGWRMDSHWRALRSEVPHLRRAPSEYLRTNFWFTTQPVEEPERPEHLRKLIDWIGWDRLLFASDYPHWDSDDPRYAFKCPLSEAERRGLFADNARAVYRL